MQYTIVDDARSAGLPTLRPCLTGGDEHVGSSPDDEARLILRSQEGEVGVFNRLVECYQAQVYALCFRMLSDREAAEDLTQETFLSAFRNIRRYRGGCFRAWLLQIAANACRDHLRVRKRRPQISLDAFDEDGADVPRQFTAPGEAPDERTLRAELAGEIQRRLGELPADQRLAVILSDIQGYSYEEIAAVAGWQLGTVKSRLSRGRARLRGALGSNG